MHWVFLLHDFVDVKEGKCPARRLSCLRPAPRVLTCMHMLMRAAAQGLLPPPPIPPTRLFSGVSHLVSDEVRALNEALAALTALEGPVTPLSPLPWIHGLFTGPLMLGESSCLRKDQPLAAFVGLLPSMLALVLRQRGAVPEALATVVALVAPLFSVSPQV